MHALEVDPERMGRVGQTAMGERVGRQQITELIMHHRPGHSNHQREGRTQEKGE